MQSNIRLANLNDLDQIWELRIKTTQLLKQRAIDQWQYHLPDKMTFISDIKASEFYVYEKDDQIIGMIAIKEGVEPTYNQIFEGSWSFDKPYLTIHRLAVDSMYLGQQIAAKLIDFAHQLSIDKHINYIRIDTHEKNVYAQRLFINFKYQLKGYILLDKNHPGDPKRLAYDLSLGKDD